jgi:scytalone dehydratase
MPAEQFVAMASDPHFLATPLLSTQHFIGGSQWEKTSEDEMTGRHQMRVAHQRYTDESRKTVALKGHAHGSATMWYRRVEGVWKFAGVRPDVRWYEYNYDKMFTDSRDHFNES